jgi:hypothetical protein
MKERAAGLWLLAMAGCASSATGDAVARRFSRPEVAQVPLQRVDVYVATAPVYRTTGALEPDAFPPPRLSERLRRADDDPVLESALYAAVEAWASERGFEHGRVATPQANPSLRQLLAQSDADAVLVVRALAVDQFGVYVDTAQQEFIELGSGSAINQATQEATVNGGRLLVGQVFAFEPRSGLRLWSRQVPDFPDEGKLLPDDPFFAYGFVREAGRPEAAEDARAELASARFVAAMLAEFPAPHPGDPAVRASFDPSDIRRAARHDAFYDDNHFGFELGIGWGSGSVSVGNRTVQNAANVDGGVVTELPDLGTGALAPTGVTRWLQPRATWITPGGFTVSARFVFGTMGGDFSRTAVVPAADEDDRFDQGVELTVDGGSVVGGGAALGYTFWLSDHLLFLPEGGASVEVWSFDAAPVGAFDATTVVRFGGEGSLSLIYLPVPEGPLFLRPRLTVQGGVDDGGRAFVGWDGAGAVGVLF